MESPFRFSHGGVFQELDGYDGFQVESKMKAEISFFISSTVYSLSKIFLEKDKLPSLLLWAPPPASPPQSSPSTIPLPKHLYIHGPRVIFAATLSMYKSYITSVHCPNEVVGERITCMQNDLGFTQL